MADSFSQSMEGLDSPGLHASAVTPSDTVPLATDARGLYVGGAGNVQLVTSGGETVTFAGIPAGLILPVRVHQVLATGTTASSIVALW